MAMPDIIIRLSDNMVAFTNVLATKAAQTALEDKEFYAIAKNERGKTNDLQNTRRFRARLF